MDAIQGNDLTVTGAPAGPVPAGTTVTLHVTYNKAMTSGQSYFGELLLGPKSAPIGVHGAGAISIGSDAHWTAQ